MRESGQEIGLHYLIGDLWQDSEYCIDDWARCLPTLEASQCDHFCRQSPRFQQPISGASRCRDGRLAGVQHPLIILYAISIISVRQKRFRQPHIVVAGPRQRQQSLNIRALCRAILQKIEHRLSALQTTPAPFAIIRRDRGQGMIEESTRLLGCSLRYGAFART